MSTVKSRLGSRFDVNRNGDLSPEETAAAKEILALEINEERAETQRKMAWTAIASMICFTIALFSPIMSDTRVKALSDLFSLFYLAQAGIVGAFMGVTTWMSNSRLDTYSSYSYQERSESGRSSEDTTTTSTVNPTVGQGGEQLGKYGPTS